MSTNDYSPLAESAIDRIRLVAEETVRVNLSDEVRERFKTELAFHEDTLRYGFEFRKDKGPERSAADSDVYFREKLGDLMTYARMAVDPAIRGHYSPGKIIDNLTYSAHQVAKLLATDLRNRTSRPRTERTLNEGSYSHQDALERLVDR